jgi:copper chaperone CopZ
MKLKVDGLPCRGCADDYEQVLRETGGIVEASIDYKEGIIKVTYDPDRIDRKQIFITTRKLVRKATVLSES